jgi:hypothetical protein
LCAASGRLWRSSSLAGLLIIANLDEDLVIFLT